MSKIIDKIIIFISLFFLIKTYIRSHTETFPDGKSITYKSSFLVDEDTLLDGDSVISKDRDDVSILVVNAELTVAPGHYIKKIVTDNPNDPSFHTSDRYKYGATANLVAIGKKAKVKIENSLIEVDSQFSDAIVALNGAVISLINSTIITRSKYSKGLVVAHNAYVTIDSNTQITTEENFSPCLELYKNNGEILATNIFLNSKGERSPLINNIEDGKIFIILANGSAEKSQILVIQGNHEVILHNCVFSGNGEDNYELNKAGVVIYNKYHDQTDLKLVKLELHNCKFTLNNESPDIPMFNCYDTEADVVLDNTENEFKEVFMKADKTENSKIETQINLTINSIGINGEISAQNGARIYLKGDQNLINNGIRPIGEVIIQN